MRFFTPELYLLFNSPDDEVADRADEDWEKALQEYQRHLDALRPRMPSQVRALADLCLHDAEFLDLSQEPQPIVAGEPFQYFPLWSAVAILSVKQERKVWSLIYLLWDRVREYAAAQDWPFSKSRKHWLYDEVDTGPDHRDRFLHRILFSDGSITEIPLVSVIASGVTLPTPEEGDPARQIA
jgi:hypothetical protein